MPYIKQEHRDNLDAGILDLVDDIVRSAPPEDVDGVLNYVVSRIVDDVLSPTKYKDMARAVSVLECAKFEFYRRVMSPYEDKAIAKNGDIYF